MPSLYRRGGKRCLDLLVVACVAVPLLPVLALVALLVRLKLGSPVIFSQQRPGLHGRPFRLFKFRTMTSQRDSQGKLLPDERRLTEFGRFLRSSSLDELPELWNILRGEMSLVGPRPLLMQYLDLYTAEQKRRHEVAPGLTGWAQVHGRNAIDWEAKFRLDVWYVDHCSFKVDLKTLWLTLLTVVQRKDVSSADHATMPEFQGTKSKQAA